MKDLEYYRNLPYTILVRKLTQEEGGGYYASMPEFKDYALFWGDGESEAEAIADLWQAFACHIEDALENGDFIPEPNLDKKVRVNVSLSQSLLNAIDKVTNNRSKFLSEAANLKLSKI